MNCTRCGSPLKPGASFCSKCGMKTGAPLAGGAGQGGNQKGRPAGNPGAPSGRPAPAGNRQPQGASGPASNRMPGQRQPPGPGGMNQPPGGNPMNRPPKKGGVKGLVAILCILAACLLLSAGGIFAYSRGMFDSFLPGSFGGPTSSRDKDKEKDRDEDEDKDSRKERDESRDEEDSADEDETDGRTEETLPEETLTEEETEAESSRAAALSTEEPTAPSFSPSEGSQANPASAAYGENPTAAMPTRAGQGGNGLEVPTAGAGGGNPSPAAGNGDYVIPDSSSRILTAADIAGLTKEQLRIARNEIYARHGRMFTTQELQDYFNGKSWYRGTVSAQSFSESMLSQLEKDNIKLIQERENALP